METKASFLCLYVYFVCGKSTETEEEYNNPRQVRVDRRVRLFCSLLHNKDLR